MIYSIEAINLLTGGSTGVVCLPYALAILVVLSIMFDYEPVLKAFGAERELLWRDRGPKSYLVAG